MWRVDMKKLLWSVLVLILIAIPACFGGEQPTINTFDANPSSISIGQASRLEWSVTGAASVTIEPDLGNVALTGSTDVYPRTTTTYVLKASNSRGVATAKVTVTVSGAPGTVGTPVINAFTASPDSITPGETSTLSWEVSGAITVSIDQGVGNVGLTGTRLVSPSTTTTYTLTATNANGSVTRSVEVAVTGSTQGTSPQSPGQSLPVINLFTASPTVINRGQSSTLQWDVSNATTVTLSAVGGDVGWTNTVSPIGSMSVSPGADAAYTLRATNSAGNVTARVEVTVNVSTGGTSLGQPDLVITGVDRKQTDRGPVVGYVIKNNGDADARNFVCKLYANGVQKATDTVALLAAGAEVTREFTGWVINPVTPVVNVVADANNSVGESNEGNNEMERTITTTVRYDFISKASSARWLSGFGASSQEISWGGSTNDSQGFACYLSNVKMEDGNTYPKVMVTHPKWVDDGWIRGTYLSCHQVKAGDHFYAKIGFVQNYKGKVLYHIYVKPANGASTMVNETSKGYLGTIGVIDVDLSPYAGKWVDITLGVDTYGPSFQDWASWIEAKIIGVW